MAGSNRNAVRSKKLLQKAYIELTAPDTANKVTASAVAEKAGVSRNTFYMHYTDIISMEDEMWHEFEQKLRQCVTDAGENNPKKGPLPLLKFFAQNMQSELEVSYMIAHSSRYYECVVMAKDAFVEFMLANNQEKLKQDDDSYETMLHILAGGVVELYEMYLNGNTNKTLDEINEILDKTYWDMLRLQQKEPT